MAYTTLKEHIKELQFWRNNRARRGYDTRALDRSIQVARAYDSLLTWRRMSIELQAKEDIFRQEKRKQDMKNGIITLIVVAAVAFILGRK